MIVAGGRPRSASGVLAVVAAVIFVVGFSGGRLLAATEWAPSVPRLIVLFSSPTSEPLAGRIEAELAAAGMVPRRVTIAATTRFEDLAATVSAAHAEGAIRVDPDGTGAEVWISDPATGRTLLRQALSSDASPAMTSVIALRTVEFLRASLLPAEARPAGAVVAQPAEKAPDGAAPEGARAEPSRLRLSLAPALLLSAGGIGPTVSAAATLSIRLLPRVGIEAVALVPVSPGHLDTIEGSSRVSVFLAGAGAYLRWAARRRWSADASAGVLVAAVRATGTSRAPFVGGTDSMMGVAPYVRVGGALGLTSWLALRADVLLGDLLPRAVIQVVDRDAATWGRPLGALLVGLQGGGS